MELFIMKMEERFNELEDLICKYESDLLDSPEHMKHIIRDGVKNLRVEARTILESLELYKECFEYINRINICCL